MDGKAKVSQKASKANLLLQNLFKKSHKKKSSKTIVNFIPQKM